MGVEFSLGVSQIRLLDIADILGVSLGTFAERLG